MFKINWNEEVIDWNKFKTKAQKDGSAEKFIDFNFKLAEVKGELIGDYTSEQHRTNMRIGNIIINTRPEDFCKATYHSLIRFKEGIKKNNDKLIRYIRFDMKMGLVAEVQRNGFNYEVYIAHYNKNCGSAGEKKIENFLKGKENYIREYIFKELGMLRFDFFLPERGLCIEFDGKQHFKPIDFFGGEEKFKTLKERDLLKNEYCKNNNIKLLRISYKDINKIEHILLKELN